MTTGHGLERVILSGYLPPGDRLAVRTTCREAHQSLVSLPLQEIRKLFHGILSRAFPDPEQMCLLRQVALDVPHSTMRSLACCLLEHFGQSLPPRADPLFTRLSGIIRSPLPRTPDLAFLSKQSPEIQMYCATLRAKTAGPLSIEDLGSKLLALAEVQLYPSTYLKLTPALQADPDIIRAAAQEPTLVPDFPPEWQTPEKLRELAQHHPDILSLLDEEAPLPTTASEALKRVQQDPLFYLKLPPEFRANPDVLRAAAKNHTLIPDFPPEWRTPEKLRELTKQNNRVSAFLEPSEYSWVFRVKSSPIVYLTLPDELRRDPEIIRAAAQCHTLVPEFPPEWQTPEKLLELAEENSRVLRFLSPEALDALPQEAYFKALKCNPLLLQIDCKHPVSETFLAGLLRKEPVLLRLLPAAAFTESLLQKLLKCRVSFLDRLNGDPITPHLYASELSRKIAVATCPYLLRRIAREDQTPELCKLAVQISGAMLEFVPEDQKSRELCEIALRREGSAFRHLPEAFQRDERLCAIAVRQDWEALRWIYEELGEIPEDMNSRELWTIAFRKDKRALQFVPPLFRSQSLCERAVWDTAVAFRWVREGFKNRGLCERAVRTCDRGTGREVFGSVPEAFKEDRRLDELAVLGDGWALQSVPEGLKDERMCRLAVESQAGALQFVPANLRASLYRVAVQGNGYILHSIPEDDRDETLCRDAFLFGRGCMFEDVPLRHRSEDLSAWAVHTNGDSLKDVPPEHKTEALCRIAWQQCDWEIAEHVPPEIREQLEAEARSFGRGYGLGYQLWRAPVLERLGARIQRREGVAAAGAGGAAAGRVAQTGAGYTAIS